MWYEYYKLVSHVRPLLLHNKATNILNISQNEQIMIYV
jgi:hypothetical protein